MKVLYVYYTRTNHCKDIVENLSLIIPGDIEELDDGRKKKGVLSYLTSGRDAMKEHTVPLRKIKYQPSKYDLVVVVSPVWASHLATPVRTFLMEYPLNGKNVFVLSSSGPDVEEIFETMATLAKKRPSYREHFIDKEKDVFNDKINRLAEAIKNS